MTRIEIIPPAASAPESDAVGGAPGGFRAGRASWRSSAAHSSGRATAMTQPGSEPEPAGFNPEAADEANSPHAVFTAEDAVQAQDAFAQAIFERESGGGVPRVQSMVWSWPPRAGSETRAGRAFGVLAPIVALAGLAVAMVAGLFAVFAALALGVVATAVSAVGAVARGVLNGVTPGGSGPVAPRPRGGEGPPR